MKNLALIFALLLSGNVFGQLGFCPGSKGDPIFHENFGFGNSAGAALGPSITSYQYVTGDPNDGQYTISGRVGQDNSTWHNRFPATTTSQGRALVVNAGFTAGKFYETRISGLCESTTYEFSAYVMNVYNSASNACADGGIPVNVRFQIWDKTDTTLLRDGSTGDIAGSASAYWEQYGLTFRTQAGQDEVILRMFNNGVGGCGNDLAIDDIMFRSCGDLTEIASAETDEDEMIICQPDLPASVNLTAIPDHSVYDSHAFQWQESEDGNTWRDIPGETSEQFSSGPLFSTRFFRVKIAEDEANLNENLCSSASDPFLVKVMDDPLPPESLGDVVACEGEDVPALQVVVQDDENIQWYDASSGGNLLASGTTSFRPASPGTYFAESSKLGADCAPSARTRITLTLNKKPTPVDETVQICLGDTLVLRADEGDFHYEWDSGQTQQEITVAQPGSYRVMLTNLQGCSAVKDFLVEPADVAGIEAVTSNGNTVVITASNEGRFLYSLDGINFQESNIFRGISGGIYTAFQRDLSGCSTVSEEFPHIVVPKFITPNNDGFNDHFELKGVEFFEDSNIRIFDRYGKLLVTGKGSGFSWNGTYQNQALPSDDYWYQIDIVGFESIRGNFTLRR